MDINSLQIDRLAAAVGALLGKDWRVRYALVGVTPSDGPFLTLEVLLPKGTTPEKVVEDLLGSVVARVESGQIRASGIDQDDEPTASFPVYREPSPEEIAERIAGEPLDPPATDTGEV